jgi:hypothetical protein
MGEGQIPFHKHNGRVLEVERPLGAQNDLGVIDLIIKDIYLFNWKYLIEQTATALPLCSSCYRCK